MYQTGWTKYDMIAPWFQDTEGRWCKGLKTNEGKITPNTKYAYINPNYVFVGSSYENAIDG